MAVVQHVPEWLKVRYPWFIQSFNIGNHTSTSLLRGGRSGSFRYGRAGHNTQFAVAGLAASAIFVSSTTCCSGRCSSSAAGTASRDRPFSVESLTTDLVLAGLGSVLTLLWTETRC